MRTHVLHAKADVVATELGIILPSFSSFFFLPRTFKSESGQRTGAKRRDTALIFGFSGWLWQAKCMRYGICHCIACLQEATNKIMPWFARHTASIIGCHCQWTYQYIFNGFVVIIKCKCVTTGSMSGISIIWLFFCLPCSKEVSRWKKVNTEFAR